MAISYPLKVSTADKLIITSWKEIPKLENNMRNALKYMSYFILKSMEKTPLRTRPIEII